jgi:hypothetical protein
MTTSLLGGVPLLIEIHPNRDLARHKDRGQAIDL